MAIGVSTTGAWDRGGDRVVSWSSKLFRRDKGVVSRLDTAAGVRMLLWQWGWYRLSSGGACWHDGGDFKVIPVEEWTTVCKYSGWEGADGGW